MGFEKVDKVGFYKRRIDVKRSEFLSFFEYFDGLGRISFFALIIELVRIALMTKLTFE